MIDLHSRKVVGYAVADHLRTTLVIEALTAALVTRKPPKGVIFHSDRGCQYTSNQFADFCAINGVRRSMGRRATALDNALAESLIGLYKTELIKPRGPWHTIHEVDVATAAWVDWYNNPRLHGACGGRPPVEFETLYELGDLISLVA